ncbi:hypothetical protein P1J78_08480 [Psychromarinibacter sp. C21-152]|uniref:Uncharacterized protein n=1 Tax=Psychromarinibacter sediminicola TaxID=3033385 RepID=A0AAE3NSD9_9RHOB|nr:hypothetical protein [Psychromarinibacter sediminicola]MDF0600764.1 hypothetical protein [Psychromarinibacter sediminicola]
MQQDRSRLIVLVLLLAWVVAFFGAFIAFYLTPAKDFGLARGWNKVGVFMAWQAAATLLALLTAIFAWGLPRRTGLRRAGFVPVAVLGLSALALAGLLVWVNLSDPRPEPAAPPSSAPAPAPDAAPVTEPPPE